MNEKSLPFGSMSFSSGGSAEEDKVDVLASDEEGAGGGGGRSGGGGGVGGGGGKKSSITRGISKGGGEGGKLRGDDFLANWAAPEVIQGDDHEQSSDIYSLGLVLWEIVSGLVPFAGERSQDEIRYKVLSGVRPELPSHTLASESPFANYVALIERAWQESIAARPSAMEMLNELEAIWRSCCHSHCFTTEIVPDLSEFGENNSKPLLWARERLTSTTTGGNAVVLALGAAAAAAAAAEMGSIGGGGEVGGLLSTSSSLAGGSDSNGSFIFAPESTHNSNASRHNFSPSTSPTSSNFTPSLFPSPSSESEKNSNIISLQRYSGLGNVRLFLEASEPIRKDPRYEGLERSGNAWVIVMRTPPFLVLHCTSAWVRLAGMSSSYAVGQGVLDLMSGPLTEKNLLATMLHDLQTPSSVTTANGSAGHIITTLYRSDPLYENVPRDHPRPAPAHALYSIHGFSIHNNIKKLDAAAATAVEQPTTSSSPPTTSSSSSSSSSSLPVLPSSTGEALSSSIDQKRPSGMFAAFGGGKRSSDAANKNGSKREELPIAFFALLYSEFKELATVQEAGTDKSSFASSSSSSSSSAPSSPHASVDISPLSRLSRLSLGISVRRESLSTSILSALHHHTDVERGSERESDFGIQI